MTDHKATVFIQVAAWIVLLQALLLTVALLMMLAEREDGPGRRAFDADWPVSGLLVLATLVAFTYAGFALLRPRLFGAGVSLFAALLNVLSVVVVVLFNAWWCLQYLLHQPGSLPALSILLLMASALAALGAALAMWSSWRARGTSSITS